MNRQDLKMLKQDHFYKIKVNAGAQVLTYSCTILDREDHSIKVEDKFGNIFNLGLNAIISYEEVEK